MRVVLQVLRMSMEEARQGPKGTSFSFFAFRFSLCSPRVPRDDLKNLRLVLVDLHREMQLVLESNTYLDRKGAVGRFEVEISRARVDKAGAEAAALKARLKQCEVVAPYDGRVAELSINEHEIPAPGKPFITLLDETSFEIDLIMPSGNLKQLKPGMEFKYHVDDTGHTYDAIVLRPGAAVDPVSQTVKVIGKFLHPEVDVIAGMTGTAEFPFQGVTQ